jgi:hypothetical protein
MDNKYLYIGLIAFLLTALVAIVLYIMGFDAVFRMTSTTKTETIVKSPIRIDSEVAPSPNENFSSTGNTHFSYGFWLKPHIFTTRDDIESRLSTYSLLWWRGDTKNTGRVNPIIYAKGDTLYIKIRTRAADQVGFRFNDTNDLDMKTAKASYGYGNVCMSNSSNFAKTLHDDKCFYHTLAMSIEGGRWIHVGIVCTPEEIKIYKNNFLYSTLKMNSIVGMNVCHTNFCSSNIISRESWKNAAPSILPAPTMGPIHFGTGQTHTQSTYQAPFLGWVANLRFDGRAWSKSDLNAAFKDVPTDA